MRHKTPLVFVVWIWAASTCGAAPIEMEIVTTRGMQGNAPREWLQLLSDLGVTQLRVRSGSEREVPRIENRGTHERPRYHVLAFLTADEKLQVPGGTFSRRETTALRQYLQRLTDEGTEGITAPRGRFNLTERQFTAVHRDLSQPIRFSTEDRPLRSVINELQKKFQHEIVIDVPVEQLLAEKKALDEVEGLTAGTGLALLLRTCGLGLRPEKPAGQPLVHRVVAGVDSSKASADDKQEDYWPVGWDSEARPRHLAPVLFEFLNVQIEGYSLSESLDAIAPRVKIPFYLDHLVLAHEQIVPAEVPISVPQTRTYYKQLLDRVLFQARLHGQLRVDEAGTVFYWISR